MKRLFYTISEVAELLDVPQPTLRFWEKQFTQLNPSRNEGGKRRYTESDIEVIKQIIFLREKENLKLDGVKHHLDHNKTDVEKKQELIARLTKLRGNLLGIRNQIE